MSESTQIRKDHTQKFLERATRASLEIIELSLYLFLYYREIYEENLFRSVRKFRKRSYSTFLLDYLFVTPSKSVILKECISPDIVNYVNQALKPAEELIRTGQLKAIHCVISHLDGPEIERLCFEIKNPINLQDRTADFFRHVRPRKKQSKRS